MSSAVIPFGPTSALARVVARDGGFAIDTRSRVVDRTYAFARPGETAEFALVLRDEGGWSLRFGPGTDEVRQLVAELDAEDAA